MRRLFFFLILFSFLSTSAQIGIEQWREHLPYAKAIAVSEGDNNRIYCATPFSAFYYDRSEEIITRMSTINGLSDVNISTLAYDKTTKYLVIAYENANIDLIYNDKVINISDIKRKSMVGSKRINKILFRDELVYLSCDFGIVVLNPKRQEIKDTYYIGPDGKAIGVLDLDYDDSLFYAATSEGIYTANVNSINLSNYASWYIDNTTPFPNAFYNCISIHNSGLYTNIPGAAYNTDTSYVKKNGQWTRFDEVTNQPTYQIKSYGDTLVFTQEYNFKYFYDQMSNSFLAYTYGESSPKPRDIIIDKKGGFWIADKVESLVHSSGQWTYKFYKPSGPAFKNAYSITYSQGQIWVAGGGTESNWANAFANKGFYRFQDQQWTSFNNSTDPDGYDSIADILKVVVNPANPNEVFIGTWGQGIIHMRNDKVVKIIDDKNSSLSQAINYPGFVGVAGLAYDQNNNLWVTNTTNSNSLSFMKPDGSWQALSLSPYITDNAVGDLVIDDMGQKWIIIPRGKGIIVYYDNNTPENPSDDYKKNINAAVNNGNLPSSAVYSLAKDNDGNIWVGTDKGVAVFYSPGLVFSGNNFDAQQIYIEQEGISQYLLESEVVTAIAIDGANRKWFGTRNAGIFLMSEDGSKQIYHFTRENSPLLNNNIYSIAVDGESGEVFIGTENGIISFRSTATEGLDYQEEGITIFPNPVRPNYNGKIAIKGLVENANVKITDMQGNMVYETTALGGQAIWNGKNFNGDRVATGVYIVFSTDETGEQTATTKIMFIK